MATITVNNTNDSGPGSLRSAIAQAQSGDIIQFNTTLANQSNPTIRLTSGQLNINKSITIDGLIPGTVPTPITISGEDKFRVLEIQVNAQFQPTNTTLKNLIIVNGNAQGVAQEGAGGGVRVATFNTLTLENSQINNNKAQYGGGLFAGYQTNTTIINSKFDNNDGTLGSSERGGGAISTDSLTDLTIIDSEFTNNRGINGGAIYSVICDLNVQNSKFINNTSIPGANIDLGPNISNGYGGAIFADGAKSEGTVRTIEINNSLFDGNMAAGQAGGLYLYGYAPDKMIVENSTIINNRVIFNNKGDSYGGGIRPGSNGQFTLKNTTIANNQALSQGGGVWVGETVPMTIINSTISGNRAESEDGKEGFGGGIALANGTTPTNIINTTIANNYAGFLGGGLSAGGTNVTLTNTLLSKNIAFNGGNTWNTNHHTMTQFTDGGGNIQTTELNPNDVKATANIQLVADALLGDLQTINGVLIHPLLAGSPAIDAGSNINAPSQDQVGQVRPVDGDGNGTILTDIGAYEFTVQSPTPTPEPTPNTGIVRTGTINNDSLRGGSGDDTLYGLAGNDTLNGLAGNDYMAGGIGNDWYYVGETGDRVVEIANAGNDRVFSTISYRLPANVERLVLQGTTAINGTGNNLPNHITGNTANNSLNGLAGRDILIGGNGRDTLRGGDGNDCLSGGAGNDILYGQLNSDRLNGNAGDDTLLGGAGADTFVFDSAKTFVRTDLGIDRIGDFATAQGDKILLTKRTFTSINSVVGNGFSVPGEFRRVTSDTAVGSSTGEIVYNTTNGKLFYNPDKATAGLTNGGLFAILTNTPNLQASDFLIR